MNYITSVIEVSKSPETVFNSITDVSKWWKTNTVACTLEGETTKLNDEFMVRFGDVHYSKQKLIEVIPNKKIVWLVTDSNLNWLTNKTEWTNTKMIFEIIQKEDKTILLFTHEGLTPNKECYSQCEKGWNMLLQENLFALITNNNKE